MARVTIEDCSVAVKNRFQLVLLASHRAREIALGATSMVKKAGEKASVLALREIAKNLIDLQELENMIVQRYRKYGKAEEVESSVQYKNLNSSQETNQDSSIKTHSSDDVEELDVHLGTSVQDEQILEEDVAMGIEKNEDAKDDINNNVKLEKIVDTEDTDVTIDDISIDLSAVSEESMEKAVDSKGSGAKASKKIKKKTKKTKE
jgi:DNA-directed RNA polymerase subunit omega